MKIKYILKKFYIPNKIYKNTSNIYYNHAQPQSRNLQVCKLIEQKYVEQVINIRKDKIYVEMVKIIKRIKLRVCDIIIKQIHLFMYSKKNKQPKINTNISLYSSQININTNIIPLSSSQLSALSSKYHLKNGPYSKMSKSLKPKMFQTFTENQMTYEENFQNNQMDLMNNSASKSIHANSHELKNRNIQMKKSIVMMKNMDKCNTQYKEKDKNKVKDEQKQKQKQHKLQSISWKQKTNKSKLQTNLSLNKSIKSKKLSDTYFYCNSKKDKQIETTNYKEKDKDNKKITQKFQSQQPLINLKQGKLKSNFNRKTQKLRYEPYSSQINPNQTHNHVTHHTTNPYHIDSKLNYRSLKRLISSMQMSQNFGKLHTVRTYSPDIQFISQQLEQKKKQKVMIRTHQEVLQRLSVVLQEYQNIITKQQKQKQILIKQNKKLKQKINLLNSQKKYRAVLQYA